MATEFQRDNYVDFIKGVAICAVVFGHIGCLQGLNSFLPVKSFFAYAWHVPVFFIVSGFFLKNITTDCFLPFIKKKFKQLYLFALCFYLPAVLLHNMLCNIGWYNPAITMIDRTAPYDSGEIIKQTIMTFLGAGREPIVGAMWFVYVLLFAMIGYACISLITNKINRGGLSYSLC